MQSSSIQLSSGKSPLALVVFALLSGITGSADAQESDPDQLWERYDSTAFDFTDAADECDAALEAEQVGLDVCLDAAALGLELRDIVEEILIFDLTLTDADMDALAESMLFAWQRAGSYMVEADACERAVTTLDTLVDHPLGDDHPRAIVAAERWLRRANECVDGNQAEADATRADEDDEPTMASQIVIAPFAERLPNRGNGQRAAGYTLMATGAVAIGMGYYFYTDALDGQDRMEREAEEFFLESEPLDDFRAAQSDAQNAATASNILYGAGIAAGVTGVILVVTAPRNRPVERPVQVSGGLRRVSMTWRF